MTGHSLRSHIAVDQRLSSRASFGPWRVTVRQARSLCGRWMHDDEQFVASSPTCSNCQRLLAMRVDAADSAD